MWTSPCGVWCRGLTTCLLYGDPHKRKWVGRHFGKVESDYFLIMFLFCLYVYIYIYAYFDPHDHSVAFWYVIYPPEHFCSNSFWLLPCILPRSIDVVLTLFIQSVRSLSQCTMQHVYDVLITEGTSVSRYRMESTKISFKCFKFGYWIQCNQWCTWVSLISVSIIKVKYF